MKSKLSKFLLVLFCVCLVLFTVSCEKKNESPTSEPSTTISFNTFTVDGSKVYGVVSNATATFSFAEEVEICGDAKIVLAVDENGKNPIGSEEVLLGVGDNLVYLLVFADDEIVENYAITIRRRPLYQVSFNVNGGTAVESQTVEEGSLAVEPQTTKVGYDLTSWNYDFSAPITADVTICANWVACEDTPYKVEYYLQKLDSQEYTLSETSQLYGVTDSTATATIKEFDGFEYCESISAVSGNIDGDGSLVLSVYYTRNYYTITTDRNNVKAGTVTSGGIYLYGNEITLNATTNVGYTFLGWYDGEIKVCETEDFTVCVEKTSTYTATWAANEDTPYKVEYYLENLDDYEYTLQETSQLYGVTDSTANAVIKEFDGFEYDKENSSASGNIDSDGSRVLKIYYYNLKKLYFSKEGNSYVVNGMGNHAGGVVVIPSTFNGLPVVSIGNLAFYNNYSVTSIVIPDSVTSIGLSAFIGCINLTSVEFGSGITSIDNYAFYCCSGLTSVVIPNSVKDIGICAFAKCSSLTSIEVSAENSVYQSIDGDLYNKNVSVLIQYSIGKTDSQFVIPESVESVGENAFSDCCYLTSVVIPSGATKIGESAFYGCTSLQSVEIPDSLTEIGKSAFYGCSSLLSVEIPDGVTEICESVFYDCVNLVSVEIDAGMTSIGSYAFYNCLSLASEVVLSNVSQIGDSAFFNCSNLKTIEISNSIISIGDSAFYSCWNWSSEVILNCVTEIGANAFYDCRNLASIVILSGITSINDYAFSCCESLLNFVIPESVTSIGVSAFSYCKGLTDIEIPYGVTSIGDWAFSYCTSLQSVEIAASVTIIGSHAFDNCKSLTSIEIPDSVTKIGASAFYKCKNLNRVEFKGDSAWYITTSSYEWRNAIGGTSISVNDFLDNATFFTTNYKYYWYKL